MEHGDKDREDEAVHHSTYARVARLCSRACARSLWQKSSTAAVSMACSSSPTTFLPLDDVSPPSGFVHLKAGSQRAVARWPSRTLRVWRHPPPSPARP